MQVREEIQTKMNQAEAEVVLQGMVKTLMRMKEEVGVSVSSFLALTFH